MQKWMGTSDEAKFVRCVCPMNTKIFLKSKNGTEAQLLTLKKGWSLFPYYFAFGKWKYLMHVNSVILVPPPPKANIFFSPTLFL